MGGRYDIMQRVKEMLDASDPLKYGDTEQSRTIELGSTPQLSPDPRLDALATPLLPDTPTPPPPVNVPPPPRATVPTPPSGAQARGQQEIIDLLNEGKKLQAVKRYRDLTGAGLAEAKAAVEAIEARLGAAPPPPPASAPAAPDQDALAAQVVALVQRGNTIEAIRVYRQATNVGLAEAKDAVDTIAARLRGGAPLPFSAPPPSPASLAAARQQEVPDWLAPVVAQLRSGNKIGAIKAYREITNVGLAEAKETVEALERQIANRQRG